MMDAASLAATLARTGFDIETYILNNPDLKTFGGDQQKISGHLLAHGIRERRALSFTTLQGFAEFLNVVANKSDQGPGLAHCVAQGWSAWQIPERSSDQTNWAGYGELANAFRRCGLRPIQVIGDSHSRVFTGSVIVANDIVPIWALCSGGSARGLSNSSSISGYGEAIRNLPSGRALPTVFHFGQVDVEFVYYYRAAIHDGGRTSLDTLRSFIAESVERFAGFLGSLAWPSMLISGIFPPSLSDSHIRQGSINAHIALLNADVSLDVLTEALSRTQFPDQRVRTAMHYLTNLELARCAAALDLNFIDVFSSLVDGSGLVSDTYNRTRGFDHHLDVESVAYALAPKLSLLLQRLDLSRATPSPHPFVKA